MNRFYSGVGQAFTLGSVLGRGGEGAVHEIPHRPGFVAKVYHQATSPEKALKLEHMARQAHPSLLEIAAWPVDVLREGFDIAVRIGYDEPFAHRLIAGSDVIMVPSHYEPCGLTQMYGLAYGALPLVRRVGGLADTVADARLETLDTSATGFVFEPFTSEALAGAIGRALALHRRPADWKQVRQRGMRQHFGWDAAASRYLALYGILAPHSALHSTH